MITKDWMSIASIIGYISNLELLNSKEGCNGSTQV